MASAVAEKIARDGCRVIYVTPLPTIATWTDNTLEQHRIIERLNSLGVSLMPNTKLMDKGCFSNSLTGHAVNVEFDELVFVGARSPLNNLEESLVALHVSQPVYIAGDCLVPGIIQAAIFSGHTVARSILLGRNVILSQRRDQLEFPR